MYRRLIHIVWMLEEDTEDIYDTHNMYNTVNTKVTVQRALFLSYGLYEQYILRHRQFSAQNKFLWTQAN